MKPLIIIVYLGIGLLIQVYGYADFQMIDLINGALPISVYAHILAWPFFVMWWMAKIGFWIALVLLALALIGAVWKTWSEDRALKRARKRRKI